MLAVLIMIKAKFAKPTIRTRGFFSIEYARIVNINSGIKDAIYLSHLYNFNL